MCMVGRREALRCLRVNLHVSPYARALVNLIVVGTELIPSVKFFPLDPPQISS